MKKGFLILIILLFSQLIFSQESEQIILKDFNNEMLKLNYSVFGGLTISQGKEIYKTGFGGSKELHNIFTNDELASLYANKFKMKNRIGNILYFSGLASMTSSLVYSVATPHDNLEPLASASLLGGGFITGMIGAILMDASSSDLLKAINTYNENLLLQYTNIDQ